jgi:twitching motility protein PilT
MPFFDLDSALRVALEMGASDLHVKVPSPPRVRVDGELIPLPGFEPITPEDTNLMRERILTSPVKQDQFETNGSADLSYFTPEGRFRVAAFSQRSSPSFVFRAIASAPTADQLGLPAVISSWADAKRGLVVITGPTGSGKSTTCAALVDMVNAKHPCHIITIEDPIEFLHLDKKALVSQREIGSDAPTYREALRAALRQDPDVILVGEVRDEETAMTALRAAETGHLVLCTMHTVDAPETVQRFIDLFGESRAQLARQMLAGALVGISSQRLVPGANGGRVLNAEVLVNSSRIRDLIGDETGQHDIALAVAAGEYYGMQTFDQDLLEHVRGGRLTRDVALQYSTNAHDLKLLMHSAGLEQFGTQRPEDAAASAQPVPPPSVAPDYAA